jgi:cytochrome P450
MELSQHPDIQERLYQEIQHAAVGTSSFMESLSHFTLLDGVFKEAQRLHTVVGGTFRYTTQTVNMLGYTFPKGTRMIPNLRAVHRSPKYYTNPDIFDPSRWDKPLSNPNAFLPFGSGPHMCIGNKMAVIEIKVALILLLQRFKFTFPSEGLDLKFENRITYSVKGLELIVEPR